MVAHCFSRSPHANKKLISQFTLCCSAYLYCSPYRKRNQLSEKAAEADDYIVGQEGGKSCVVTMNKRKTSISTGSSWAS
jgi:hypothetical protein